MPADCEIEAAMKALHFERNPPGSGRWIPWVDVPLLTKRALERDAREALALAISVVQPPS